MISRLGQNLKSLKFPFLFLRKKEMLNQSVNQLILLFQNRWIKGSDVKAFYTVYSGRSSENSFGVLINLGKKVDFKQIQTWDTACSNNWQKCSQKAKPFLLM